MADEEYGGGGPGRSERLPRAVVQEKSRISLVWLIPIVALLVGGWLVFKALTERGPEVRIRFESAEGLEAGKTKVKYKDVEVGVVESIALSDDLAHVVVSARLTPAMRPYLHEGTRFWVVRARISAGQVSGLGTVFSGAYIGLDPSTDGPGRSQFIGLETPPVVTSDEAGRLFTLRSRDLGSIDVESPVYFRWLKVGRVASTALDEDGEGAVIQVFVNAPYDQRVDSATRFWNASGLDVSVGADGVRVDTVSVVSLLIGGVAFDNPSGPGQPVEAEHTFDLYPNKAATTRPTYRIKTRYLLNFEQSVAGLSPGAPVELRGIKIGEVVDVRLVYDPEKAEPRTPVLIEIEPERIEVDGGGERRPGLYVARLVEKGLRAQLKTGNLLTGQLAVTFDFFPNAPPAQVVTGGAYPELPTIPSPLEEITGSVAEIVARLEKVPFEKIGANVEGMLAELRELSRTMNQEMAPELASAVERAEQTMASVQSLVDPASPTGREVRRLLVELADAARSLRVLADHLEQHPEDLLRGKKE